MPGMLEIYTLGNFTVKKGERIYITEDISRLSKRWKLFQYLFTFRRREVSREELIMVLDLDDNSDARGSLTALVYRLRKLLHKEREGEENHILTRGGSYTFNQKADYWLDAEEFAGHCNKTSQHISQGSEKACSIFEEAIELYQGNYLDDLDSEEWIWNARNKYRDLLVSTLQELAGFMSKKGLHEELWQFYEQAQEVVQFDESLIKGSIESLLGTGNVGLARIKYEEAISLYEDNDLSLPPGIKELKTHFRREKNSVDPSPYLRKIINRDDTEGAYVCDPETFTVLYDLEKRRTQREVAPRFLVHLRLVAEDDKEESCSPSRESEPARYGDFLVEILRDKLRCGDVVCRWSKRHFIILLVNLNDDDARKVLERIENAFRAKNYLPANLKIKSRFYQL